jgi:hypothetical protein
MHLLKKKNKTQTTVVLIKNNNNNFKFHITTTMASLQQSAMSGEQKSLLTKVALGALGVVGLASAGALYWRHRKRNSSATPKQENGAHIVQVIGMFFFILCLLQVLLPLLLLLLLLFLSVAYNIYILCNVYCLYVCLMRDVDGSERGSMQHQETPFCGFIQKKKRVREAQQQSIGWCCAGNVYQYA